MLSDPKTSDPKQAKSDASADLIHDLAEAGTASELGTVKAASDAVEGEADKTGRKPRRKTSDK